MRKLWGFKNIEVAIESFLTPVNCNSILLVFETKNLSILDSCPPFHISHLLLLQILSAFHSKYIQNQIIFLLATTCIQVLVIYPSDYHNNLITGVPASVFALLTIQRLSVKTEIRPCQSCNQNPPVASSLTQGGRQSVFSGHKSCQPPQTRFHWCSLYCSHAGSSCSLPNN